MYFKATGYNFYDRRAWLTFNGFPVQSQSTVTIVSVTVKGLTALMTYVNRFWSKAKGNGSCACTIANIASGYNF